MATDVAPGLPCTTCGCDGKVKKKDAGAVTVLCLQCGGEPAESDWGTKAKGSNAGGDKKQREAFADRIVAAVAAWGCAGAVVDAIADGKTLVGWRVAVRVGRSVLHVECPAGAAPYGDDAVARVVAAVGARIQRMG